MLLESAIMEMRFSCIPEEVVEEVIKDCKSSGLTPQNLDKALEKRGYEKVFYFEYEPDGFESSGTYVEKNSKKHTTYKE